MTSRRFTLPLLGLLLASTGAQAQYNAPRTDTRWYPFLGCWATSAPGYTGPTVCLLPSDSTKAVDIIAVSGDSVLSRSTVTADGARHDMAREGCTGWESATWSQDDRRLFTRAEFRCGGGPTQVSTGIYAMNHTLGFVRVEGVKTRGATRARVVNFQWVDTVRVPGSVATRLPNFMGVNLSGARVEASAQLSASDVVEASREVEADVVAAWLGNRGQTFNVAARDLRALRDAKVPTNVIDMMVAVSYPKVFAVMPGTGPTAREPQVDTRGLSAADRMALERARLIRSAMGFGWGDMYIPYAYSAYDPFFSPVYGSFFTGWSPFYNPYWRYGPFFNGFNNGLYGAGFNTGFVTPGTYYGNGPYIIAPAQPVRPEGGRVINGAGYSASDGPRGGTAQPTPTVNNGGGYSGGGASSGGGYSGGASSGGASGGASGGGERTAKPRP